MTYVAVRCRQEMSLNGRIDVAEKETSSRDVTEMSLIEPYVMVRGLGQSSHVRCRLKDRVRVRVQQYIGLGSRVSLESN